MNQTLHMIQSLPFPGEATQPSQEIDLMNHRLEVGKIRSSVGAIYLLYATDVTKGEVVTIRWDEASSQLKAAAPTYGQSYELYVIASVVVGGASLSGGEGRVFGTLVGAFIIAVIRNGMNLTNVEPYTQKVALGLVILGAVLLDMLRRRQAARSSAL